MATTGERFLFIYADSSETRQGSSTPQIVSSCLSIDFRSAFVCGKPLLIPFGAEAEDKWSLNELKISIYFVRNSKQTKDAALQLVIKNDEVLMKI